MPAYAIGVINLSKAATRLAACCREIDGAVEDIEAFCAPLECVPLALRGIVRKAEQAAALAGYGDVESLIEAIEQRTTAKWVYEMGFHQLTRDAQEGSR